MLVALLLGLVAAASPVRAEIGPSELAAGWVSMEPASAEIWPGERTWAIPEHGVSVVFKGGALTVPAWFTFTPRYPSVLPYPHRPIAYFFDLWGTYAINDQPVSLGASGIEIELTYDDAHLGGADPESLRFLYRGHSGVWETQESRADLESQTISLRTARIGSFGVGGEPFKLYLALVVNE
jgi:hypothetical protein